MCVISIRRGARRQKLQRPKTNTKTKKKMKREEQKRKRHRPERQKLYTSLQEKEASQEVGTSGTAPLKTQSLRNRHMRHMVRMMIDQAPLIFELPARSRFEGIQWLRTKWLKREVEKHSMPNLLSKDKFGEEGRWSQALGCRVGKHQSDPTLSSRDGQPSSNDWPWLTKQKFCS